MKRKKRKRMSKILPNMRMINNSDNRDHITRANIPILAVIRVISQILVVAMPVADLHSHGVIPVAHAIVAVVHIIPSRNNNNSNNNSSSNHSNSKSNSRCLTPSQARSEDKINELTTIKHQYYPLAVTVRTPISSKS